SHLSEDPWRRHFFWKVLNLTLEYRNGLCVGNRSYYLRETTAVRLLPRSKAHNNGQGEIPLDPLWRHLRHYSRSAAADDERL
ncbi:hypothetical protein HAX54_036449, partial [Datura stramonium]|nr:hypothetical protein [Datura stramonium]